MCCRRFVVIEIQINGEYQQQKFNQHKQEHGQSFDSLSIGIKKSSFNKAKNLVKSFDLLRPEMG